MKSNVELYIEKYPEEQDVIIDYVSLIGLSELENILKEAISIDKRVIIDIEYKNDGYDGGVTKYKFI